LPPELAVDRRPEPTALSENRLYFLQPTRAR